MELKLTYPTKNISILLPTRGRAKVAHTSLLSLVDKASNNSTIEYLVAIDNDDVDSIAYFNDVVLPEFRERGLALTVFSVNRIGYEHLNEYVNFLALQSLGSWLIFWNDDAIMESQDWDKEIGSYTGQFKLLAFTDNHDGHPYSIFPIVPRDWLILFNSLSPQQQSDAWLSQLAYLTDCFQRIETKVTHDRADLTGNNNDEIYQTRRYFQGDMSNPLDINAPEMQRLKIEQAAKISWYLKKIGQDTGWFDLVIAGKQDPWEKLMSGDGAKHMNTVSIDLNHND